MDWTAEAIDQLRALWDEGHSTAEIGRRMGVSKNAVVGKAHRLNLPARPSPIRREAEAAAASPRPAAAQPRRTLPPREPVSMRRPEPPAPVPAPARPAPAPALAAAPTVVVRPFPRTTATRSCCWPMGEPGTPEFRFCAAVAMPAKPYCTEHAAIAYVKARDRREDAA